MNNALKYVKILEGAGITREQAEAHIQIMSEITEGDLATKQDLQNLGAKLGTDIQNLDTKLSTDIRNLDTKLSTDIRNLATDLKSDIKTLEHKLLEMEYRMTIKLGTIVTIVVAAATTASKLL